VKTGNDNRLILGAGLAGLSVAHYLGDKVRLLEAGKRPGGLCQSYTKDNFVYDIGGHILFSKDKDILNEILGWLGSNVHQKRRKNEVWYKDRFVKYPFENDLSSLDKQENFECLMSFLQRKDNVSKNLYDWCVDRFGTGIAQKYLIPYNEKIWKRDPKNMSLHWVDRIPSPPMEDIIKSAIGIKTEGYTHQLNFSYPKTGGIESLIKSLITKESNIKTEFRVNKIIKKKDEWHISDGNRTEYCNTLISTMPIFDLVNSLENVPEKVVQALSRLQYNSMILVMVGVNHTGLQKQTAFYIPDPNILPHRVCFLNSFSEFNAPTGCSHLVAEITLPPEHKLLKTSKEDVIQRVINDVKDICEFKEQDIISTDYKVIKYAYVVYDSDYLKNRKIIFDYLDFLGIFYTGRFGSFKYINMDACVRMSKDLVFNKILLNSKNIKESVGRVLL